MDGMVLNNSLAAGFYTVSEAARLIEIGSAKRILGWLQGYSGRQIEPLLTRDFQPIGKLQELSFLDLMEVRFVEHFREQKVKVRTLRRSLQNARTLFKSDKPLASRHIRFVARPDKKDVFAEEILKPAAEQEGDERLWSLVTRQFEFYSLIREQIQSGVYFDPLKEFTVRWAPRPLEFPDIMVDPAIAYGQPAGPSHVPTRVLYESWMAEAEDAAAVADWYRVPVTEVTQAVEFENKLSLRPPRLVQ